MIILTRENGESYLYYGEKDLLEDIIVLNSERIHTYGTRVSLIEGEIVELNWVETGKKMKCKSRHNMFDDKLFTLEEILSDTKK